MVERNDVGEHYSESSNIENVHRGQLSAIILAGIHLSDPSADINLDSTRAR